ncbi:MULTISPECIES: carboxylesterase/lipase family protein [Gordonia]|jgi:para-nitrobenzyl esterase|nr:carboxylesterase/lipase family protein [Gordonia pseudamarae]
MNDGLVVTTSHGSYRGARGSGADVWKGIRYARARRWRRAEPPAPHTEIIEATTYGAVCPQALIPGIDLGKDATFSEDCLFLNVWRPTVVTPGASLPVMVWIHGGAYVFGSGSQGLYDATTLAVDGQVVVVTVNYRLGALGFADLSTFNEPGHTRFESNAAMSDVLAALTWVRAEIAGFGGDPENVTVFGESAGAGIVTTLLTMPAAENLFHRAIAESSPATSVYGGERAAKVAGNLLSVLGIGVRDVARLHDLDIRQILPATMKVYGQVPEETPGTLAFAPVVDGDLLPRHPMDVYRAGESMSVPLLIGTNKDEAALFTLMRPPLMPVKIPEIKRMFDTIRAEDPTAAVPTRESLSTAYAGASTKVAGLGIARDIAFRMPTVWLAEAHGRHSPVYLYRFDWATKVMKALQMGATHATELPYVWGNPLTGPAGVAFRLDGRKTGEDVSHRMRRRWTAFAHLGIPSGVEPQWPAFDEECRSTLVIDATDRVVDDLDAAIRRVWGDQTLHFR